jgi:hypothetical protein
MVSDRRCTTSRVPKEMDRSSMLRRGDSIRWADGSEFWSFLLVKVWADVRLVWTGVGVFLGHASNGTRVRRDGSGR